jgi:hypothetical protein
MRAGVTSSTRRRPGSTPTSTIGQDTLIQPNTQLLGATTIGAGGGHRPGLSRWTDMRGRRRRDGHAVRRGAPAVDRRRAPPSARSRYLRPGTELGAKGKIGGFVETKNAEIGAGAKVPHLTYCGDADDRRGRQHRRRHDLRQLRRGRQAPHDVGRHSFVGSQLVLVAPVDIGRRRLRRRRLRHHRGRRAGQIAIARGSAAQRRRLGGRRTSRHRRPRAAAHEAGSTRMPSPGPGLPSNDRPPATSGEPWATGTDPAEHPQAHHREEPHGLLRARAPRAGRGGRRGTRHHLGADQAYDFANSEIYVRYEESVRGCDAFVIQSHTAPINEWIMEHLIMVDALKRASAKRITVVLPFYGYARQDKKHRGREPISARLIADLFKTAGADRLICVDLHTDQIQGFFDGPVDHLLALPILADYVREKYGDEELAVVSPDAGRIKVAEQWSARGSVVRRWRSSTRPATSTGPTRPSPTASSVRSRGGSASWSTT